MATKSVATQQLRVGMYVAKLDVSWFRSPFLRHSFLIHSETQIDQLRRAGIQRVQIDPSRGEDVAARDEPSASDSLLATIRASLSLTSSQGPKPLAQLNEELAQAKIASKQLEQSVRSVFASLSERGSLDHRQAADAVREIAAVTRTLPHSAIFMALSSQRAGNSSFSQHALATCTLSLVMGQSFEYNPLELQELAMAALLHDIGLLQIPAAIIQRSANTSSPLSRREQQILQSHPQLSILTLERQGGFETRMLQLIGEHHVRLNGSGYPQGTRGEFTSERSRILMIADHYDELITGFGGASPLTPHQALQRLYQEAQEGLLDRTILSSLIKLVGIYPVHSRVRLNTQEQAVVTELNPSTSHQPVVAITHNPGGDEMPTPLVIDLSDQATASPERAIATVMDTPEPRRTAHSSRAT
ncbi:HD-GYP domain-containing protein [Nitrospira sp. NS4]|uniref:HD-GYP domain-containing protein n=1 Tax=Nitrospira sp. NS4 TaxID=3414498 RepID=UPI003C2DB37A